jgi:phosphopantetheine binding protein
VGVHDNFFELGGHSLLLIQLATRASKIFNVEIPLGVLFDVPTIYQMTLAIAELQLAQEEILEAGDILGEIKGLSPEEVKALLEAEAGVERLAA